MVGAVSTEPHRAWPWSGARWRIVTTRTTELCELLWAGNAGALRQAPALRIVRAILVSGHGGQGSGGRTVATVELAAVIAIVHLC